MLQESFLNVHWLSCFRGCFLATNYLTLQIFMKTICSFQFELTQKLKQYNILNYTSCEKRSRVFLQSENFWQKYKLNKYKRSKQTCHVLHRVSIFKSNLIIPLMEGWKNFSLCCVIVLSYIFFDLCPFHSWQSAIYLRSVRSTHGRSDARNHWWTLHFAVFAFCRV